MFPLHGAVWHVGLGITYVKYIITHICIFVRMNTQFHARVQPCFLEQRFCRVSRTLPAISMRKHTIHTVHPASSTQNVPAILSTITVNARGISTAY